MPTDKQHALHTCVRRHIVEVMGDQTDIEFQELLPYGSTRKTASRAFSHVLGKSHLSLASFPGSRAWARSRADTESDWCCGMERVWLARLVQGA